ncbi:AAA family ATPase [Cohnella zeiphila]|uniref:AAA family ATPase n=1 Tax=Cohnella zeiphila TaxID=2761120 RepID=A0A7X0VYK8_9BACL|nr:AAA family ATPase [Cohnella zeiphila]MBB6734587.1 AAA family ATPase [Cohnella zeiphila]
MIIWLNGAFGAGKTQTAYELHRRLPNSHVFDPENAGYYIRKNVPKEAARPDFQDYRMWREINYAFLKYLDQEYGGTLIVPMTVVSPAYFAEIVGRLRADGVVVQHFALCVTKETLLRRLRSRGERNSWAVRQIDRCIEGLADEAFRDHLQTDDLTIPAVAETIAARLGLDLQPDRRSGLARFKDRILTQIRHIRFFP